MKEEIRGIAEAYIDKFISSEQVLIKINDERYPVKSLHRMLQKLMKERGIENLIVYTFQNELFLEKI
jgi:hypothetical protein